jgi:hypothetical protein
MLPKPFLLEANDEGLREGSRERLREGLRNPNANDETITKYLNGKSPKDLNQHDIVQNACTLTRRGEVR